MFPSSNRVKLNRLRLKDAVALKLTPRKRKTPRAAIDGSRDSSKQNVLSRPLSAEEAASVSGERNESSQDGPEPTSSENQNDTVKGKQKGNHAAAQKAKWRNELPACAGDSMEGKGGGPNTEGKYEERKPNSKKQTRAREGGNAGLGYVVRLGRLGQPSVAVLKVDHNPKTTKMPSPLKLAAFKETGGQDLGDFTIHEGHRCTAVGDRDVFGSVERRDGQGSEKAEAAGGNPGSVAAVGGQMSAGTRSEPSSPARFVQDTHLNLSELAGSEGCLRRSVGASLCIVCGEYKYISPRPRTVGKQKPTNSTPDSGPPPTMVKVYGEKRAIETVEKIVVWINEYPKVSLCDIAARFDICSHNCGYILPDDLKNKKMCCFKRDIRAGFRIWPSCIGRNSEQGGEAKNGTSSPSVQSGNSIRQAESLREQHKHPEEGTASEVWKTPSTHFYNGWTDVDPTIPASLLKSKRTEEDEIRTCVLDQDQLDYAGLGSDPIALEIHRDKRMKLEDGVERSRVCSTALKENKIISRADQNIFSPTECDAFQMSPALFSESESDEVNEDEPELSTCQRVIPYFRELPSSCARTYKPWPFTNSQPRRKVGASATACSETGSSQRIPNDSVTKNVNLPSSSTEENHNVANLRTGTMNTQSGKSVAHLHCRSVPSSGSSQLGMEPDVGTGSTFLLNRLETNSSTSTTTTHTVFSLTDWEASSTLSNSSDPSSSGFSGTMFSPLPSTFPSRKIQTAGKKVEEPQLFACSPLSFPFPNNSYQSLVSSIGFSYDQNNNDECLPMKSPPRLEPYDASPFKPKYLCNVPRQKYVDFDSDGFLLPPELSPITSPYRRILGCTSFERLGRLEHKEEFKNKDETPTDFYLAQVTNGNTETSSTSSEHSSKEMEGPTSPSTLTDLTAFKSLSSPSNTEVDGDEDIKETVEDSEKNEDGKRRFKQVPLSPKVRATVGSNVPTEGSPSPSSPGEEHTEEEDEEEQCSSTDEESSSYNTEDDQREPQGTKERESDVLDEFTAYEQDILLVDVVQEDPELFENLPEKSLLNLGPVRDTVAPKKKPIPPIKLSSKTTRSPSVFDQKATPVAVDLHDDCTEIAEEMESRPWRPRCSNIPTKNQNPYPQSEHPGRSDRNSSKMDGSLESTFGRLIHPHVTSRIGQCTKNPANLTDFRRQKSNEYCRQYFSESLSCGFKMCRFQHLPAEGDEKFCVDMVTKFSKNPACLQKAGAVFTGYYQNSPPGAYFSMPVLLTLLWSLLKAGMVSNVFSVLRVSLARNIVPGHEFLLALFNYVRDKDLMSFVPELMQLTFKMAGVGLELSLDCIDNVRHSPMFQQAAHPNSHVALGGSHNSSACTQSPEYLNLVHGIVEIELCAKQEDWKRMGEVYRSVFQFSQHPNQVERISGRIAIALLSESKDKVSLPFAAFAETARQNESEKNLVKTFVGRIGVSLMLRYHKNHHWMKGRRVVEVMSALKVDYTTLKSLFGNEDGASRCCLITVATELFLLSGSVEGALNTLREHNWFLSSGLWPCEPTDLESRTNVLRRLAGKTSHRDTLEVLCNMPGVKEPSDLIDISRYSPLFTSHLQACVERQVLPVASDLLDFMLSKQLAVDHSLLQTLLEKLGRQNLWLRAREVFKRSLSAGYYPDVSAAPGVLALVVPCQLGEVELALALEMFVAFNASAILSLSDTATSSLGITLKRTQTCEGEYISAGNRLLSAACLPQPKLAVRYTAVNSSQEQLFRLDVPSARRWLRHNHLWASEMWTQRPKGVNPN